MEDFKQAKPEILVLDETREKMKELSDFSTDPESTMKVLYRRLQPHLANQKEYARELDGCILTAKRVIKNGGNLLSPEALDAILGPAAYKQSLPIDKLERMGNDFVQAIKDNRHDRETALGDDDRWQVTELRKGTHNAISDTARRSGHANYVDNSVTEAGDEEDEETSGELAIETPGEKLD
jgi:hypothetical protein